MRASRERGPGLQASSSTAIPSKLKRSVAPHPSHDWPAFAPSTLAIRSSAGALGAGGLGSFAGSWGG